GGGGWAAFEGIAVASEDRESGFVVIVGENGLGRERFTGGRWAAHSNSPTGDWDGVACSISSPANRESKSGFEFSVSKQLFTPSFYQLVSESADLDVVPLDVSPRGDERALNLFELFVELGANCIGCLFGGRDHECNLDLLTTDRGTRWIGV